jgi:membrane protein implicated in regulation of membrane protease activity
MQSRKHSALEATLNTASGFLVSLAATFVIYPLVGIKTSAVQNLWTVIAFTFVSVLRSYFWRRLFNWWQHEAFHNHKPVAKQ